MNMKKLLFALSFCCSVIGFAQVGVGTATPDASAQLDVKSLFGKMLQQQQEKM
jgi:hypothetical protein